MGTTEIVVIAGVGLLMFGPARIPEFARQCGKAVSLFKSGLREAVEDDEPAAPSRSARKRASVK